MPGLTSVRNAALTASADASALAFIDDDEIPEEGWLSTLLRPWIAGEADFVSGSVMSVFDGPLDAWIEGGGFFRRQQFRSGERMQFAATNNLLIDLEFVRANRLRFDDAFALSGGEDIAFTQQAHSLGARIVACPEARVLDPVPRDRMSHAWILRRVFRQGATTALCDIAAASGTMGRLRRKTLWFVKGVGGVVVGAFRWILGAVTISIRRRARGARLMSRGSGMATGSLGMRYRQYRGRHTHAGDNAQK